MKKKIDSEFSRNILKLTAGTAVAQLIPFAVSPVLSRLYTPEDFALAEMFVRLFGILLLFSTLRYELAIVLPEKEEHAYQILRLIFRTSLKVFLVLLIVTLLFSYDIARLLHMPDLEEFLWLLPFTVLMGSIFNGLNYWHIRQKSFTRVSVSRAGNAVTNSTLRVALGFGLPASPLGLVISQIFAFLTGSVILLRKKWSQINSIFRANKKDVKVIAKKYRDFPRVNLPHALLDAFRDFAFIFIATFYFGDVKAGYYAFAIRLMKTPLAVVGSSIAQVFLQRAAAMHNEGQSIHRLTVRMLWRLSYLSFPFFIVFAIIAPGIFDFIFGDIWEPAGHLARILCPWLCLHFIISPLSQIPIILGKQQGIFIISIIGTVFTLFAMLIGTYHFKDMTSVFLILSLSQSLYILYIIYWTVKQTRKS